METKKKMILILLGLGMLSSMGIQFSFVWGSEQSSFSLVSMMLPLAGMVLSVSGSLGFVGIFFAAQWLIGFMPLAFGLPTACQVANWSLHAHGNSIKVAIMKFFLNVLLPLAGIIFFVMHPVGSKAAVYSLFWLIPMVAYIVQLFFGTSFFLVALSSAFIAHGVGSVIWLNVVPMTPEQWIALMPIVAVERLVFTLGSFLVYVLIQRFMGVTKSVKILESEPPGI